MSNIKIKASENWTDNNYGTKIVFETNTNSSGYAVSERMVIDNNGRVGIGTTTPASTLDVYGNVSLGGYTGSFTVNTAGQASTTALTVSGNTYLSTIVSGTWNGTAIGAQYGGTGSTTLSGILKGNGTSAVTTAVAGTDYESSANKEILSCVSLQQATSTDDSLPFLIASRAMTVKSIFCQCNGTCTTGADFALKDNAGNRMTQGSTTCSTTGVSSPATVTANNTLTIGEALLFDIVNSPTTGGNYILCASSTIP
jgi:hypothetical protein